MLGSWHFRRVYLCSSPGTVGDKNYDPYFHAFLVGARVMNFVTHCTETNRLGIDGLFSSFLLFEVRRYSTRWRKIHCLHNL